MQATFIVNEKGTADSLKILQGINAAYDKAYRKIFYDAKDEWKPAILNGKPVKVLMHQEKRYSSSENFMTKYLNAQKANKAYMQNDYETALYYYDQSLQVNANDATDLYYRGICKQKLGNISVACNDWQMVKALKINIADSLIKSYCK